MELSRVHSASEPLPPFHPSTLAILFTIVEVLMIESSALNGTCSQQSLTLQAKLNQNQRRLLRWGVTVPWCWMVWGSDNSAYFETATWIVSLSPFWPL